MYRVHWLLAGDVNFPMHHLHKNRIHKISRNRCLYCNSRHGSEGYYIHDLLTELGVRTLTVAARLGAVFLHEVIPEHSFAQTFPSPLAAFLFCVVTIES